MHKIISKFHLKKAETLCADHREIKKKAKFGTKALRICVFSVWPWSRICLNPRSHWVQIQNSKNVPQSFHFLFSSFLLWCFQLELMPPRRAVSRWRDFQRGKLLPVWCRPVTVSRPQRIDAVGAAVAGESTTKNDATLDCYNHQYNIC